MKIKEEFLHYLWKVQKIDASELATEQGEAIQILDAGEHNSNAGPDFLNARLQIGDTIWAGNIEMHVFSSDWNKHEHSKDPAYDNVILHVVYEQDEIIRRKDGEQIIPCLELRKRIPPKLTYEYLRLIHNEDWIPCQSQIASVSDLTKNLWLDRLLIERLETKTKQIEEDLQYNLNDWESTFYKTIARYFGVKINMEPFELLARSLPLLTLAKHKNNLFQIEALLFGQAGLLEEQEKFTEDYPNELKKEYAFLKKKYNLQPLPAGIWRFMRLRPANFPTVRIAQFAALIHRSTHLFSKVMELEDLEQLKALFEVEVSEYWHTHYVFDKPSKQKEKALGNTMMDLLVVNVIVPFLFLYGRSKKEEGYEQRAVALLEIVSPESNHIIEKWVELGFSPKNAYQTQALLQLKNAYCGEKRCLNCAIGDAVLKQHCENVTSA